MIANEDLLDDLARLETELDQQPRANDVIRDGEYSVNTYYNRFGWSWSEVINAFEEYQETGEVPDDPEEFDYREILSQNDQ